MRTLRLGRTDIELSAIGLGCWQFGKGVGATGLFWQPIGQREIDAVVAAALAGGISWFDTAEAYGGGASEQALAAALKANGRAPGTVRIATKWMPILRRARSIGTTIGRRLECLAPYPIDLHQVHQPWSLSSVAAQMRGMAEILREGKIRAVGVSNFPAAMMREAHAALEREGISLASNQVRFNLLDRRIESSGVLEEARRLGVSIISYSPLAQGMLTGRFHDDPGAVAKLRAPRRLMNRINPSELRRIAPLIDVLRSIGGAHGASICQVALNWTVSFHGDSVLAIPGATRPPQAAESAAALGFVLSRDELDRIDDASRRAAMPVKG